MQIKENGNIKQNYKDLNKNLEDLRMAFARTAENKKKMMQNQEASYTTKKQMGFKNKPKIKLTLE